MRRYQDVISPDSDTEPEVDQISDAETIDLYVRY